MSNFVSISEAAKATKRSTSWVRNKAKVLLPQGLAVRNEGRWEVDINALMSVRGAATKIDTGTLPQNSAREDWQKMVDILREDNRDLRAENKQLRAELNALLSSQNEGMLSRWFRG